MSLDREDDLAAPERPGTDEDSRRRWEITILATMYVGYAAFMLCRNAVVASQAALVQDPSLGIDKAQYGRLMSLHSAGAIAGKLVTGVGADLFGGRRMFLLALALTAAANVAFGMASSFLLFGILNFLGQFFKAGGWPAMAKIIGHWYSKKNHGRVWSIISTSSRVGAIAATLILGFLLTLMPWRAAFLVSAIVAGLVVVIGYVWLKECPEDVGLAPLDDGDDSDENHERERHPLDDLSLPQACFAMAKSARVWLICLSLAFLTVLMDFINFVSIYLTETLDIEPGQASMTTSAFPAGMFVALIATSLVYDRLSKRRLVGVLGGLLCVSCLCVVLLSNLGNLGLAPWLRLPAAAVSLFLFGFTISPAYYVPMSVFSIAFGGQHSGFLIALIDVFGYAGALIFNYFGGTIADEFGWPVFLAMLLTVTVLALSSMTAFLYLDYRADRAERGRRLDTRRSAVE